MAPRPAVVDGERLGDAVAGLQPSQHAAQVAWQILFEFQDDLDLVADHPAFQRVGHAEITALDFGARRDAGGIMHVAECILSTLVPDDVERHRL